MTLLLKNSRWLTQFLFLHCFPTTKNSFTPGCYYLKVVKECGKHYPHVIYQKLNQRTGVTIVKINFAALLLKLTNYGLLGLLNTKLHKKYPNRFITLGWKIMCNLASWSTYKQWHQQVCQSPLLTALYNQELAASLCQHWQFCTFLTMSLAQKTQTRMLPLLVIFNKIFHS